MLVWSFFTYWMYLWDASCSVEKDLSLKSRMGCACLMLVGMMEGSITMNCVHSRELEPGKWEEGELQNPLHQNVLQPKRQHQRKQHQRKWYQRRQLQRGAGHKRLHQRGVGHKRL